MKAKIDLGRDGAWLKGPGPIYSDNKGHLLTENIQGLRAAFRAVKQVHPFTLEAVVMWRVMFICWIGWKGGY